MSKIEVCEIYKSFKTGTDELLAVEGISLRVADGEFLCILGPSGCGKSALLMCVAGLYQLSGGAPDNQGPHGRRRGRGYF